MTRPPPLPPGPYRIGTAASLSGVPASTLRTWERRHGAVRPDRTEGRTRQYSAAQVERLWLLGRLTASGQSIASLAALSTVELQARLDSQPGPQRATSRPRTGGPAPRWVLLHRVHGAATELPGRGAPVETLTGAMRLLEGPAPPLVVVAELGCLGEDPVRAVTRLRASRPEAALVVLIPATTRALRQALQAAGCRLHAGPATLSEIGSLVDLISEGRAPVEPASRTPGLSLQALHTLLEVPPDLACECPNHLARIALSLHAFEEYARRCVVEQPADAALHGDLAATTRHLLHQVDGMLRAVCAHDGIDLQDLE